MKTAAALRNDAAWCRVARRVRQVAITPVHSMTITTKPVDGPTRRGAPTP